MYRSVKYLLQPTKGQALRLNHLLEQQRLLYNAALRDRKSAWMDERRSISRYQQHGELPRRFMEDADLAQYGIRPARGTLDRLDEAFQGFYRRCAHGDEKPGYPRFKAPCRWDSVTYPDVNCWRIEPARLRLMGVGCVRLKMYRPLPGRPKSCTVRREGRRWLVVVVCQGSTENRLERTGMSVGIDMGVANCLTTSAGETVGNPRFTRLAEAGVAAAQRERDRKVKGSRRYRSVVQRVASQQRKVANRRRDYAHKTSRMLINEFDLIVHEDLAIRNMVRRPNPRPDGNGGYEMNGAASKAGLNKAIQDAGWGQLLKFIAHKAEEAGREVIAVNPRNTSRTCSACGHCEKDNRQTQAKFECLSCGFTMHADENAAINILRAGLAQRLNKREVREVVGS